MDRQNRQETIAIKNRDIPRLQRVVSLMQDIKALEERMLWERERMVNITQHLSWAPGGGAQRGLDAAYAALSGLEEEHQKMVQAYARELKRTERVLNGIGNPRMRTFVALMYVLDRPPGEVRSELNLTEWGFRRARQAVEQAKSMERVIWRDRYILGEAGGEE